MEKATEKQISYAASLGLDVSQMSMQHARNAIDQAKNSINPVPQKPFQQFQPRNNGEFGMRRREKDTTSMYVSYVKDLFIELRKVVHEEQEKQKIKINHLISDDVILERCIAFIKKIKKEFE